MSAPAAGLLTIDVDEELRKLSTGGLAGAWEVPTELVRWACARGATQIEVECGRHDLRCFVADAELDPPALGALAELLDTAAPAERRHAALLALEPTPAGAWIGLLALEARTARLECGQRWLTWGRHRPVASGRSARRTGLVLELRGATGLAAAAEWLRSAARFALPEIRVDKQPLERGFDPSLPQAPLPAPLAGRVCLPRGGRSARVLLTLHGVLAAHLTVPDAPPFEAVLAADGWAEAWGSRGALRDGVRQHLTLVVDSALDLMLRAARDLPAGPSPAGADLRAALLQAARRRLRLGAVLGVPLIDVWSAGRWRRASLLEAGELARAQGGVLEAVAPGDDPTASLARGPLLALDAEERARLAELLGTRFALPPRRSRSRPRRLRERWLGLVGAAARCASRASAGAALPASSLNADERTLLEQLEVGWRLLAPAARLVTRPCRGRGRPFLRAGNPIELWLPLGGTALRRAAQAGREAPPLALAVSVLTAAGWRGR